MIHIVETFEMICYQNFLLHVKILIGKKINCKQKRSDFSKNYNTL